MTLYPLLTAPCFRSGSETPWGGSMLRDAFLKEAPERCGESLEVCALPGRESCVRNGEHAGVTLAHMIKLWGAELTGTTGEFPLLVKLIDAAEPASFDSATPAAWVVLNCEPGTQLTAGEEFSARPGEVFFLPANLPRSVGADVQLYAVQPAGEAPICTSEPAKLRGVTSLCKGGSRTYYVCNEQFELCRLNVSGAMPVSDGRMLLLTTLGPCTLRWGNEELDLSPFDTAIIPAALEGATIISDDCKLLMATLPRQESLRAELNYRSEGVSGLQAASAVPTATSLRG